MSMMPTVHRSWRKFVPLLLHVVASLLLRIKGIGDAAVTVTVTQPPTLTGTEMSTGLSAVTLCG